MDSLVSWYSSDPFMKDVFVSCFFPKFGKLIEVKSGFCGDILVFDQGENCIPRFVCVKIPKRTEQRQNAIDDFKEEIKFQMKMWYSPFVVMPFDVGWANEVPYACYRFWNGSLEDLLKNETIPEMEMLSLLFYIAKGLEHCHSKGMIAHQDLKPGNIFIRDFAKSHRLGPDSHPIYKLAMLADFGTANGFEKGSFNGAKPYSSPEQILKQPLSNASDVFSLGIIAYEIITKGNHPIGIKISDWWPSPKVGHSKRYIGEKHWKKWAEDKCPIKESLDKSKLVENCIVNMLEFEANNRPPLSFFIECLQKRMKEINKNAYDNMILFSNWISNLSTKESLEKAHPYLNERLHIFVEDMEKVNKG